MATQAKAIDLLDRQRRLAWILILPAVIVVFLVVGYPLGQVLVYSLLKYKLDGVTPATFIGIDNYVSILTDSDFWSAFLNTLVFSFFSVTIETVLGLVVALVASSQFKGRSFLRVAILVPWAIPTVVSSKIWMWMFNDVYGIVNIVLINFHLIHDKIAFLAKPETAMPVIIAVDVWKTTPFMSLLLLAGLGLIPADMYEAASIDGASKIRQFFSLTLPLLMPTLLVALIFRTLDALRVFDIFYIMVGSQGSMATLATYNQQWLVSFLDAGMGSAVSVIILVVIMAFVILYTRFSKTSFS